MQTSSTGDTNKPAVHSGLFDAHQRLHRLGLVAARRTASTSLERICIDAAATLQDAGTNSNRAIYGSLAVTCLPHRNPGSEKQIWLRRGGHTLFAITPGTVGFPYGAKARVILLHLIDRAIRASSPTVEIGTSMHGWLHSIGVSPGGMSYHHIHEQSRRIADCSVTTLPDHGLAAREDPFAKDIRAFICGANFDGGETASADSPVIGTEDKSCCPRRVFLDPGFYNYVQADAIALDRLAIQQISDNGWALDTYMWLAGWLPRLEEPMQISWAEICRDGFGSHGPSHKTKAKLLNTLPLVKAIYPQAKVAVTREGMVLLPSPPAA